jgi:soluble lytic murein transglycosylase
MDKGIIPWESGGNGEAVGGSGELGSTQLMPGTARQMASKLGLPYRPDMLKSNALQAKAYQRALGMAYLQQGLEATGTPYGALRYYNGGPGFASKPSTDAYARNVLAKAGY